MLTLKWCRSFGSTRKTEDVDIAVSKEALYEFDNAAANNSRFKKQSGGLWEYTSNTGIIVKFDFRPVGGAMVPKLKVVEALPGSNGGFRAVPAEMLMAKVVVCVERGG